MGDIRKMFNPRTIALVGASGRQGAVGQSILENLLQSNERKIFPVNPKHTTLAGLDCYPSVLDIHDAIDLVVIATPAHTVPGLVDECGRAGAEGAIIVSKGLRGSGNEGNRFEDEISDIRKKYGLRIIGPNCLGIIRPQIGLNTSFLKITPLAGNIAFISQSGQFGDAILDWGTNAHIGFSMFASLGSMIDVDYGDLIDFLGDDYQTRSIMIYMEKVGNAKRFLSSARGFARSKPMVVLKPGMFAERAQAGFPRAGAMAGSDRVYDAAFKRVGLVRVKEVMDLFNVAEVLDSTHLPRGPRLAIVTNAEGVGIIATDALLSLEGELATLSGETIEKLDRVLPPYWSRCNPVDILEDADIERFRQAIQACLEDPGVDGVHVIHAPRAIANRVDLAKAIVELARKSPKPMIATRMGGTGIKEGVELLQHNAIPTYDTPEQAVKTYMYMHKYKKNLELLYQTPTEVAARKVTPKYHLKALVRKSLKQGTTTLNPEESVRFLDDYGIPTVKTRVVQTVEAATSAARDIGYPVVLKIVSPDIHHKSDVGGVITGVWSEKELKDAYKSLTRKAKDIRSDAVVTGVTVQKMIESIDYEVLIGSKKDEDFGSVVAFGMGGIGSAIFRDVAVALPPLNQTLALRLMEETMVYRMLQGYGGKATADIRQLERLLVQFSSLIVDFPELAEVDINPVAISGGNPYVLDAKVVLDPTLVDCGASYPHLAIAPYPTRYVTPTVLPDGTEVLLRPIRPEDEPLEYELLSTLSEQTMKERFFSAIKDISHDMLFRFCNIDYEREMAIVAEVRDKGKKRIIGIGRLTADPDLKSGQFAVLVHDDFHGQGLGYTLIDLMIGIAQDKSLEEIYGIVLSENSRMLNACRKLGFVRTLMPDGISRVSLMLI